MRLTELDIMIVADSKPINEIVELIGEQKRILILGCNTCVAVCMAGGEKEVAVLAGALGLKLPNLDFLQFTVERQCDREFLEAVELIEKINFADMIISLACGAGEQTLFDVVENKIIVHGVNTRFMGSTLQQGIWAERCRGCGDCKVHIFGGVCPVARCSKNLLNGPCGGSSEGKCEVDPDNIDCAWQIIYDRLKSMDKLSTLEQIQDAKDWKDSMFNKARKRIREDLLIE